MDLHVRKAEWCCCEKRLTFDNSCVVDILRMKVSWVSSASQLSRDVNGGEVSKGDQRIFYFSVSETISRAIRRFFAH